MYPTCMGTQDVNMTQRYADCTTKCSTASCRNATVVPLLGDYSCQCSSCNTVQKSVCGYVNGTLKRTCVYPVGKCLLLSGSYQCAVLEGGKSIWVSCKDCLPQ
eukprot:PhF_6_TR37512/c1_g2_i2/m.55439